MRRDCRAVTDRQRSRCVSSACRHRIAAPVMAAAAGHSNPGPKPSSCAIASIVSPSRAKPTSCGRELIDLDCCGSSLDCGTTAQNAA
jgi:hypothetical protein